MAGIATWWCSTTCCSASRTVFEIADRGSRGGRAILRATAVPARMSGGCYYLRGGVACTDVALRVTHPPRDPRPTGAREQRGARAAMLGGGALGVTRPPRATRYLPPDPVAPPRESSKYRCPGGHVAPGAPPL